MVEQKRIDLKRIFIYGHSIGGAIAIDLASRHPDAAGLIAEAAFTSIFDMALLKYRYRLLPMGRIVDQKFDSLKKATWTQLAAIKFFAIRIVGSTSNVPC